MGFFLRRASEAEGAEYLRVIYQLQMLSGGAQLPGVGRAEGVRLAAVAVGVGVRRDMHDDRGRLG